MLNKFEELDAKYDEQDARLKLLEEQFWLTRPTPTPKFAPGTLPEVTWPDNFFKEPQ